MALHSGDQIASHLRTVIKSTVSRRSAVLIVLTQGPLGVKHIIVRNLESVLISSLRTFVTSFTCRHWTCTECPRCVLFSGYLASCWQLRYSSARDLKGFAPQRLEEDILSRATVRFLRLIECKRLGYDCAFDRHLSRSSNDP